MRNELVNRPVLLTSDAAVADPHQVVFGSLVARHQIVDLGVNSNFFAPCNQIAAHANKWPKGNRATRHKTYPGAKADEHLTDE